MTWFGLIEPDTGDLVSVGTEAMLGPDTPARLIVQEFGATPPDFAVKRWDAATRSLLDRPAPVFVSRLDDIESWLLADPDWSAVFSSLNAARRTQIRTGFRRVLQRLLGSQVNRQQDEQAEV